MVNCGRGIPSGVLRGDRHSRESTGSTNTTAFRGSILGGADQADSCLSFVVPLLELILGDSASIELGRNEDCAENPAPLLHWTVIHYGEVMRSTGAPTASRTLFDFAASSGLFYPRPDTRIARNDSACGWAQFFAHNNVRRWCSVA